MAATMLRVRARRPIGARGQSMARAPFDLDAPAPPYDFDPSAWSQRLPICALALVALLVSTSLALYQWRVVETAWDPLLGGAARVLDSDVSAAIRRWTGLPDAALGALAYLGVVLFGLAGSTRRWQAQPWLVVLLGLDVTMLATAGVVLVVLQGAVIGSWCSPCLATAAISLVLVALARAEVWASVCWLRHVWRTTGSGRALWDALGGRPPAGVDPLAWTVTGPAELRGAPL